MSPTRLKRVVGMPQFVNPNRPESNAGSINLPLADHPVEHAESYGQGVDHEPKPELGYPEGGGTPDLPKTKASKGKGEVVVDLPENRDDWTKKHWQAQAREYGLTTSGNTDTVQNRVEEYEDRVSVAKDYSAGDWKDEIEGTETEDDLAELRKLYDESGADFSTVVEAFDERATELKSQ